MTALRKILIVDDEPTICEALYEFLSPRFEVHVALDTATARTQIARISPDLIILDSRLRGESGVDFCRSLRSDANTRDIRVLMYSGLHDTEWIVEALSIGADDYISKLAPPEELVARIEARMRRVKESSPEAVLLKCGNLSLDLAKLEVKIDDEPIPFSVLEFNLLRFFLENKNRVISREEIMQKVWRETAVSFRTIDTHMVFIRKKLSDFDHEFRTVYGAGYMLRTSKAAQARDAGQDTSLGHPVGHAG